MGEGQQRPVALAGLCALAFGAAALHAFGWRHSALFVVGGLLGAALYHGAFGFTAAYRNAIVQRDVSSLYAQLFMLGLATLLMAPLLAAGRIFGQTVIGATAPVGFGVAVGSFVFGAGMQLGNGCGSGTLYTVGGGSPRMLVTLAAFCIGGFLASLHMGFWQALPNAGEIVLGAALGWPAAVGLQLAALLGIAILLQRLPGARMARTFWSRPSLRRLVRGSWPLALSAAALAVLNAVTLILAGHPWTITWAFTLWGAKAAAALGWEPATSAFWADGFPAAALRGSVFADVTSIMDIGMVIGALAAAGLGGRFAPRFRIPLRSLAAALLGGLLMGYGARIAYGCNIGAFFSGVASTSLHGWLWILCALPGNWLGVKLRPLFGLGS